MLPPAKLRARFKNSAQREVSLVSFEAALLTPPLTPDLSVQVPSSVYVISVILLLSHLPVLRLASQGNSSDSRFRLEASRSGLTRYWPFRPAFRLPGT